jgi:hypothetical protein
MAKTILSIEIGKHSLQKEKPALRITQLFLCIFLILELLLHPNIFTSASVAFITNTWRLQESLLTASQLPSLLKAIE